MGMVITMFHVCILDDDPAFSAQLHTVLDDYFTDHKLSFEIDVYHSSEECLKALARTETSYQLYFLDILMPGKTGLQVAEDIRKTDKTAHIIFLTSSLEYAIEGYKVRAYDYLEKPLDTDRLYHTLEELLGTRECPSAKWLQVKSNGIIKNIPYNNICYIEAKRNKLLVVENNGERSETYGTFSSILTLLEGETDFTQTHRSFLINMRYIREFATTSVTLQSGEEIPVSRNYCHTVKQAYFEFAQSFFS